VSVTSKLVCFHRCVLCACKTNLFFRKQIVTPVVLLL
jgi:hypothetical protein